VIAVFAMLAIAPCETTAANAQYAAAAVVLGIEPAVTGVGSLANKARVSTGGSNDATGTGVVARVDAAAYEFTTIAGLAPGSADGTGGAAQFNLPSGVAVDGAGNVYVADTMNYTIRKITPAGAVTTFAGAVGQSGSADGMGGAARFNGPTGVAVDGSGNVYVADTSNSTIRKITPGGEVTTLAGAAEQEGSADGTGSAARFNLPWGLAVDIKGNVYVADARNSTIRMITPEGAVTTLAGAAGQIGSNDGTGSTARFDGAEHVAVDSAGNVYVGEQLNETVRKITPSGVVTTLAGAAGQIGSTDGTGSAARFTGPSGVAVDSAGNVYVADGLNSTIRKVTPVGVVTTLAGTAGQFGDADGTGGAAQFAAPTGVAVDRSGIVYVGETYNDMIREVTPAGVVTTLAGAGSPSGGSDGMGSAARFFDPMGVAVDHAGNVYVIDNQNFTIRKVTPGGGVTTLAGAVGQSGSSDGTGSAARFVFPLGVAVDNAGNVFVADDDTIRKITPAGVVSTLAGAARQSGSADGTGGAALFAGVTGVALDSAGNVYVADGNNCTIRKITPAGVVTTLAGTAGQRGGADGTGGAAEFWWPRGVAVDGAGNVYVADADNAAIRKITPAGVVTTLAGALGQVGSEDGLGSVARFNKPFGVALDAGGNVYVVDTGNSTIRKVTPAGEVTTLAGTPGQTGSADGLGSSAQFFAPYGIAADAAGNVYVADTFNFTIRMGVNAIPVILVQPSSQSVASGSTVVFSVAALSGTSSPAFAWSLDGVPLTSGFTPTGSISGTTGPTLVISGVGPSDAGTYVCTVTNAAGVATSAGATLAVVVTSTPGRLIDISARAFVGTGANVLIAGYVIQGSDPLQVLLRSSGPALVPLGVTGVLPDPQLQLYDGSTVIASNAGWGGNAQITSTANAVGAFAWTNPASKDSALLEAQNPGAYTAITSGVGGDTGVALAEVYDATASGTWNSSLSRLGDISARAYVGTGGNVLIAGFVIGGSTAKTVLIRASGPALTSLGVTGALPDPQLQLYNGGAVINSNAGWGGNAAVAAAARNVGAFTWSKPSSNDSAILVTLPPGAYTAIVSGVSGDTGVALAEVYDVP